MSGLWSRAGGGLRPVTTVIAIVTAAALVAITVGWPAAAVAALAVAVDRRWPQRRVLAWSAVAALAVLPAAWWWGSSLPLSPPAARLQDNALAHELAGLGVWLLVGAVASDLTRDRHRRPRPATDDDTVASDTGEQA